MKSEQATLIDVSEAQIAYFAVRLVSVAEVMRLVPSGPIDNASVTASLEAFAREGVARHVAPVDIDDVDASRMAKVLSDAMASIEDSPLPKHEWTPLVELLGDDLLAKLVRVSGTSIQRYRSGGRSTPDHVADRLHFLTLVVADLYGSYNDFGIRRWFDRSRSALSDHSPAEVLSGDWQSHDEGPQQVRELAASLLAPQAA